MHRLHAGVRIDVGHRIVDGYWGFSESSGDQFYFSGIGTDVSDSINARDGGFHLRVHDNCISLNLESPFLHAADRRRKAIIDQKVIDV